MAPDDEAPTPSTVDISQSIVEARQQAASAIPEDGPDGELMATYAVLGDLLDSGRTDRGLEEECRALVDRLIVLGKANEQYWHQKWVAWASENTTFGGDVW